MIYYITASREIPRLEPAELEVITFRPLKVGASIPICTGGLYVKVVVVKCLVELTIEFEPKLLCSEQNHTNKVQRMECTYGPAISSKSAAGKLQPSVEYPLDWRTAVSVFTRFQSVAPPLALQAYY